MANPKPLLNSATHALKQGNLELAQDFCHQILEKFPDTLASDRAQDIIQVIAKRKKAAEAPSLTEDKSCSNCGIRILGAPAKCANCGAETGLTQPPTKGSPSPSKKKTRPASKSKTNLPPRIGEEVAGSLQSNSSVDIHSRICDYRIVRKKFEAELVEEVRKNLKHGWVPWGGVSYVSAGMSPIGNTGNTFIQAMVKLKR